MFDRSDLIAAEARGLATQYWAKLKPDAVAAYDRFGERTFARVAANANRIVRLLRAHGVLAGDHIAFVCGARQALPGRLHGSARRRFRRGVAP
jgi:long-chain acyl-CoA synthetase